VQPVPCGPALFDDVAAEKRAKGENISEVLRGAAPVAVAAYGGTGAAVATAAAANSSSLVVQQIIKQVGTEQ